MPYLTAGAPWIISKLVNNQPGLICEALETSQHNGDGYVEVDIDVGNFKGSRFSAVAKRIIDTVCPRVAKFVIDLAFMMQGEEEDELPERLIGTVRLIRLDLAGPSSKGFVYDRTKVTRAQQHAISRSKGQKAADDVDDEESMSARSSEALSPL